LLALLCPAFLCAQDQTEPQPRPNGPYQIRGKVVNGLTGQGIAEVRLSVSEGAQPSGGPFEQIETGPDGSFRFDHLAEGKYSVQAARQGYAPQAYLQHENFWTGIAVGAAKDSQHLRFKIFPSATMTGQVLDENSEPVRGASAVLLRRELNEGSLRGAVASVQQTNDEGRYRFDHLPAGKYTVSVTATPWYSRYAAQSGTMGNLARLPVAGRQLNARSGINFAADGGQEQLPDLVYPVLFYSGVRDENDAEWLTLRPGETAAADFHLQPMPSLHVQVFMGETDPERPPSISLIRSEEGQQVGVDLRTVSPGVMEASGLLPGRYHLVVQETEGETSKMREQEVDLAENTRVELASINSSGLSVRGEFHTEAASPGGAGIWLQLKTSDGRAYDAHLQSSGTTSRFEFAPLPQEAGTYRLLVINPPGATVKTLTATGAKVSGLKLQLDGTQNVQLSVTAVQDNLAIQGMALKEGQPFAGAMILLLPENPEDWAQFARRDQSDSDGTFRIAGMAAGNYTLLALENGWELEWAKPEVMKPYLEKGLPLQLTKAPQKPAHIEVQ